MSSSSAAFAKLCRSRRSVQTFKTDKLIAAEVLHDILELTQSAPSSFNLQPYKLVLVQSRQQRDALASAVTGYNNSKRVREAPLTVVFAADKEPSKLISRLVQLETANGADSAYVRNLPHAVNFLLGKGLLSRTFRTAVTHLLSPLQPTPMIPSTLDAWACKNAAFAAQTFMLAAQAHGLGTAPMEGYDERRVGFILGMPLDRYTIPLVVSAGYPDTNISSTSEGEDDESEESNNKRRFPLSDVVSVDYFVKPYSR